MKLITKLYDLKWYKALPIWYVIMASIVFGLYSLLGVGTEPIVGTREALIKLSLILAIPFSLLIVFTQIQINKNVAFWERAEAVEKRIDEAETLEELNKIINEEFDYETGVLRKMVSGLPHLQKVKEMHKVMETKAKYIK